MSVRSLHVSVGRVAYCRGAGANRGTGRAQAFRPDDAFVYADADLKDYGPIDYKAASIYARMKRVREPAATRA